MIVKEPLEYGTKNTPEMCHYSLVHYIAEVTEKYKNNIERVSYFKF